MAASDRAAVDSARARRTARAGQRNVEIKWSIDEVANKLALTMKQRVRFASELLKNKVVRNISRPVTKTAITGGRNTKEQFLSASTRITNRSKAGEFPKADTTQLLKSIFAHIKQASNGVWDGYVGTNLDYGVILEVSKRLDRSYLVRSLRENQSDIQRILTGPIK